MTRGSITPREPIRATPRELAEVGIDYRSDDLFLGRETTDEQPDVHFGLARLTHASLPFWRDYRLSSGRVANVLNLLAVRLQRPDDRLDFAALAAAHGWSREAFEGVVEAIRRRKLADKKIFRNVQGGVVGHEWLFDESFAQTEDRFIAYAAKEPLGEVPGSRLPDRTSDPAVKLRHHRKHYAEILMTVAVATERNLPTVTHFGIFRNPTGFVDPDPSYRRLAMRLHGFAATVELHALAGKHFLVTEPMAVMTRLLGRKLSPVDLYEGHSDADARQYINRHLPAGTPPIPEERRFNWAGFTLDSRTTVVRLGALAHYYRPTDLRASDQQDL